MALALKNSDDAYEVIRAWERRQYVYKSLMDERFPKQRDFVCDDSRLGAAKCTRRAGKSGGLGRLMHLTAKRWPKSPILYLLTTRDECKYVMWEPVLKPLNEKLGLGGVPNETELSMKFPNGSYIRCFGVDAKPDEMKKVLGVGYRLVVVDEAQKFRNDLRQLVYEMLMPAMSDLRGKIRLTGTPDELTSGLFYDVTKDEGQREPGWSVHEWNTHDNPYMAEQWAEDIAMLKQTNPLVEQTPAFQRMYLGKWVIDTSALVYKFSRERNVVKELPTGIKWTYVLGIDLGWNDASAFTLYAYNVSHPHLYIVESYKSPEMSIDAVAKKIRYYMETYDVSRLPCDPASKQVVEELRNRYQIPLVAAEKTGKAEHIEIMNADFTTGVIKLVDDGTKQLQEEYDFLIWDKNAAKKEEHPICKNDCSDSSLYGWRYCYQYFYKPKAVTTVNEHTHFIPEDMLDRTSRVPLAKAFSIHRR